MMNHNKIYGWLISCLLTTFSLAAHSQTPTQEDGKTAITHVTGARVEIERKLIQEDAKKGVNVCSPEYLSTISSSTIVIPRLINHVNDYGALLTLQEERRIDDFLFAFERRTGSQIAIITIRSVGSENINVYGHRLACAYRLGRKNIGDGVLIVLAAQERKITIETMKSAEKFVTNEAVSQILNQDFLPAFRLNKFEQGLLNGTQSIMNALEGHFPTPEEVEKNKLKL